MRTAIVTTGPIEASITASGTIVPEVERVLSSPLDARVLRILARPGAAIKAGDPVVQLDVSESVLGLDKLVNELKVKENKQAQTRLGAREVAPGSRRPHRGEARSSCRGPKPGCRATGAVHGAADVAGRAAPVRAHRKPGAGRARAAGGPAQERRAHDRCRARGTQPRTQLRRQGNRPKRAASSTSRRRSRTATACSPGCCSQEGALVRGRRHRPHRRSELVPRRRHVSDVHAGRIRPGMPAIVRVSDAVRLEGAVADVYPDDRERRPPVHCRR